MNDKSKKKIQELNDRFRKGGDGVPGRLVYTQGVLSLLDSDEKNVLALQQAVQTFDEFNADNNPFLEHDFAAFDFMDQRLFWKFDYYAPDLQHGSSDATDLTKTVRVLTVMLAREY